MGRKFLFSIVVVVAFHLWLGNRPTSNYLETIYFTILNFDLEFANQFELSLVSFCGFLQIPLPWNFHFPSRVSMLMTMTIMTNDVTGDDDEDNDDRRHDDGDDVVGVDVVSAHSLISNVPNNTTQRVWLLV